MIKKLFLPLLAALLWSLFRLTPAYAQEPPITVTVTTGEAEPGFIFAGSVNIGQPGNNWLIITNEFGRPVFTRKASGLVFDFKRQGDVLTYFNSNSNVFEVLDQSYTLTDTWQAVGYETDIHDLQILDDGSALLLVYKEQVEDLSAFGGHVTATVISCTVQEILPDKTLAWEWDSRAHNPLTHSVSSLTTPRVDYDHCNAVEEDSDGNILVSSRNLSQITKIDRTTGDVIWKLGGAANEFTFVGDNGFALQHDIRRLENGHITLFDNGPAVRGYSRAVEYEIDEAARVLTRTWEHQGPHSFCCGSAQRLPGGNTLIGWGLAHPTITEVTPDGTVVFAADLPFSYRAFKLPWFEERWLPLIFKQ